MIGRRGRRRDSEWLVRDVTGRASVTQRCILHGLVRDIRTRAGQVVVRLAILSFTSTNMAD